MYMLLHQPCIAVLIPLHPSISFSTVISTLTLFYQPHCTPLLPYPPNSPPLSSTDSLTLSSTDSLTLYSTLLSSTDSLTLPSPLPALFPSPLLTLFPSPLLTLFPSTPLYYSRYQPSRLEDTTDPEVIISKAKLILNKLSVTNFEKLSDQFMSGTPFSSPSWPLILFYSISVSFDGFLFMKCSTSTSHSN